MISFLINTADIEVLLVQQFCHYRNYHFLPFPTSISVLLWVLIPYVYCTVDTYTCHMPDPRRFFLVVSIGLLFLTML